MKPSVQLPPCWHGDDAHSSISVDDVHISVHVHRRDVLVQNGARSLVICTILFAQTSRPFTKLTYVYARTCVRRHQLFLPTSQCSPMKPAIHSHVKPLTPSTQLASTEHGDDAQSSMSTGRRISDVTTQTKTMVQKFVQNSIF